MVWWHCVHCDTWDALPSMLAGRQASVGVANGAGAALYVFCCPSSIVRCFPTPVQLLSTPYIFYTMATDMPDLGSAGPYYLSSGVLRAFALFCMAKAYAQAPELSTCVALRGLVGAFVAYTFGDVLLHQVPSPMEIGGITLAVLGVVLIATFKRNSADGLLDEFEDDVDSNLDTSELDESKDEGDEDVFNSREQGGGLPTDRPVFSTNPFKKVMRESKILKSKMKQSKRPNLPTVGCSHSKLCAGLYAGCAGIFSGCVALVDNIGVAKIDVPAYTVASLLVTLTLAGMLTYVARSPSSTAEKVFEGSRAHMVAMAFLFACAAVFEHMLSTEAEARCVLAKMTLQ